MLNALINPDGTVLRFINKLVSSVWLHILWFICSIPIITIGPSTTALFYCCQKVANDEEGYITKAFFHSFKSDFKQAVLIGLITTLLGIIFVIDGYVLYHLYSTSAFWTIITALFVVAVVAYIFVIMWIFPLLAHFENTTIAMFKNSMILSIRFLLCSVLMLAIYFAMLVIIIRFFTPAVIFGFGTCALLNSMLLKNIFIQCEQNEINENKN